MSAIGKHYDVLIMDDIVENSSEKGKKVLSTKIGAALLRHLAKYPDVLSTEYNSSVLFKQDMDKNIPQRDDL